MASYHANVMVTVAGEDISCKTSFQLGIEVMTPDGPQQCKAIITLGSFDLPAKAKVMNFKQYNGEYSCSTSLEKGDNTLTPNPRVRYWPFQIVCTLRTKEGVIRASREAATSGEAVFVFYEYIAF